MQYLWSAIRSRIMFRERGMSACSVMTLHSLALATGVYERCHCASPLSFGWVERCQGKGDGRQCLDSSGHWGRCSRVPRLVCHEALRRRFPLAPCVE
ncbi:hypothetical protein BCV70DRAFT_59525 [Testicularia cyperi]|uniref:Uncharacterized protein n=1 Tax=Testicularia cyperi TaxID=1882483 RepID=A0A317XWM3_9BASI|nr:hypothetical protein BCV70DRAFT_59525 [Testicularia cyperi]